MGSQGETPEPKRANKKVENYVKEFKTNEFSLEDFKEIKPKNTHLNQQMESESFFSSSLLRELKELHSPNIGKNRLKNVRVDNYSCGREFESINIEY